MASAELSKLLLENLILIHECPECGNACLEVPGTGHFYCGECGIDF